MYFVEQKDVVSSVVVGTLSSFGTRYVVACRDVLLATSFRPLINISKKRSIFTLFLAQEFNLSSLFAILENGTCEIYR